VALVMGCGAAPALAQVPASRFEVGLGGGVLGGAAVDGLDAELRGSSSPTATYRLFGSEAGFAAAGVFEARVGWRFTPRYAVEGHGMFVPQDVRVSVTADAEGAPPITVAERVDRYVLDAGLVVLLEELRVAGLVPFAAAGAGYVRQLHEGAMLVEHGHVFHVGAGVKRMLFTRRGRVLDGVGVRGDVRLYVFGQGLHGDDSPQQHVSATGSVVFGF
jgi:hypothetical protein